ncbi:MAG: hypothetical protein KIS67_14970 [Verrucomicrobiae bacterium]|nr:hypothetical protein [Verrucomicrobiae bacterium]
MNHTGLTRSFMLAVVLAKLPGAGRESAANGNVPHAPFAPAPMSVGL